MSNYGAYPGSPQEPWSGRPPQEPYGQPSDPWGGHDPWGGAPTSTPPGGPGSPTHAPSSDPGPYPGGGPGSPSGDPGHYAGYDQSGYAARPPATQPYQPGYAPAATAAPAWQQPAPPPVPPRRRGNGPLVALVVVLALLVVAGGVAALVKLGGLGDGGEPRAATTSQPATDPSNGGQPVDTASPAGADGASVDARFVKKGQCVVNQGSERDPSLKVVKCGAKTLEVIARFDGTTDYKAKCESLPEYDFHYYYDSQLDTLDFVLCLKQR